MINETFFAAIVSGLVGVLIGGAANNIFAIRPLQRDMQSFRRDFDSSIDRLRTEVTMTASEVMQRVARLEATNEFTDKLISRLLQQREE